MNKTKTTDPSIRDRNQHDDYNYHRSEFTHLFNNYREELFDTAFRLTRSKPHAEDVVHDVFLKLWLKRSELQTIARLRPYLHIMIRNRVFDNIKKSKHEHFIIKRLYVEHPNREIFKERLTARHYIELLHRAVQQMPAKQQQVYRLVKEFGLSYKAAAETMQISDLTVKKHISNALRFIQDRFTKRDVLQH